MKASAIRVAALLLAAATVPTLPATVAASAAAAAAAAPVAPDPGSLLRPVQTEPDPAPTTGFDSLAAAALSFAKSVVGTKDAPVDGQDGKPHAGPYVAEPPPAPKNPAGVEDIPMKGPVAAENGDRKPRPAPGSLAEEAWKMGPENDGVMLDRGKGPKDGPRGTEGGVSEKSKDRKTQEEQAGKPVGMTPDGPKEAPPLPPSEDHVKGPAGRPGSAGLPPPAEKPKGAVGLERPSDLPDKPHSIPHPERPSLSKGGSGPGSSSSVFPGFRLGSDSKTAGGQGEVPVYRSFFLSTTVIIFSEIGDKTFLVAALMAMRHPRMLVFSAAFSAVFAMTILSACLGHAVPVLLPQVLTTGLAAMLFFIFGVRLMREGLAMDPSEGVGAEMKEVENELDEKERLELGVSRAAAMSPSTLEAGRTSSRHRLDHSAASSRTGSPVPRLRRAGQNGFVSGLANLCGLLLSPAWVQTFVMTFLGEWGDRSQIAILAMAAGDDWWTVTAGALLGHAVCTGAAVIGGRAIAGRVSMRVVTLGGAAAFLVFGLVYLVEVFRTP